MQFFDIKSQFQGVEQEVRDRIDQVFQHGGYIMGPEVEELEAVLRAYVGVEHCIAVSSGTDALLLALMAADIGQGDEVITTPFSFFATVEVIMLLGATPLFVDVDPENYNLNPQQLEKKVTPKTKAIIPVDLYGQCADYDPINEVAERNNLVVIEDGAQSFGATYKGRMACSLGNVGCTSFFPSKPLGGFGDGGACFTNDPQFAQRIREFRIHGQSRRYQHASIGVNGRLDTLQAAMLLAKLPKFPQEVIARREVGERYSTLLSEVACRTPRIEPYNQSVYAQYTVQVDERDKVVAELKQKDIPTAVHYPLPLHHQPALQARGVGEVNLPVAESLAQRVLSLPMHPYLTESDQQLVVEGLKEALG